MLEQRRHQCAVVGIGPFQLQVGGVALALLPINAKRDKSQEVGQLEGFQVVQLRMAVQVTGEAVLVVADQEEGVGVGGGVAVCLEDGGRVLGGAGKVRLQTIAHSPGGYGLEAGFIDEQDAMRHEDRHIVSNVIGDPAMHVGLSSPLRLRALDSVVLGSDGLFDNLYVLPNFVDDQTVTAQRTVVALPPFVLGMKTARLVHGEKVLTPKLLALQSSESGYSRHQS